MTLRRTLILQLGGLICLMALVAAAALWGINSIRQDFSVALDSNQTLRELFQVGAHVSVARAMILTDHAEPARVQAEIARARTRAALLPPAALDSSLGEALGQAMELARSAASDGPGNTANTRATLAALDRVQSRIALLTSQTRQDIELSQRQADAGRILTIWTVAGLSLLAGLTAALIGYLQIRTINRPLTRLRDAAGQIADGRFDQRVHPRGFSELAQLADSFNKMAQQLQHIYNDLEDQVRTKSRELARSERLASVGHLAAGVAHEINNPLGIIAGYAELALRQSAPDAAASDPPAHEPPERSRQVLQVIVEETYRCKRIIDKLLSLARGGEAREPVNLHQLASDLARDLSASGQTQQRSLSVQGEAASAVVSGDPAELRQVLHNLVLNAIHATDPQRGVIELRLHADAHHLTFEVHDNGIGIEPDDLPRVFEPFFTVRVGQRPPGTGLGLSISHAIIRAHGGELTAASPGRDRGASFSLRLPRSA